jgi:CHAD domain-containing protein/adenylate cyclase class IV
MPDAPSPAAPEPEAGSRPPREVELKYLVRDDAVFRAWLESDWTAELGDVTVSPSAMAEVEDVYFDTPHRALERHGFGARLRRRGGKVTLTVKSAGRGAAVPGGRLPSRALRKRIELEAPASTHLDPDAWPESPAKELVEELRGAAKLRPLFTIRQRRHERRVASPDGTALFTLDEVEVHAGKAILGTFTALEVESSDGREALLERVAAVLEASGLVTPEPRSKEEIASDLVAEVGAGVRTFDPPKVPKSPGITPDDSLAEAGRKVLRMHLAKMLSVEAGTRSGEDIEDLHKMRVATRRMRAVWRVFDGAYKPRVQRRYVRELREVAASLGLVRDLDVMLENLGVYLATLPEDGRAAMEPMRADWERQREGHRRELVTMLDSRDYRDFVEDYLDFTETSGAGEQPAAPGTPTLVRHTAAGRIWIAYERVRSHATTLAWADVPALHALRIDCKRLRYTLESFREVLPAKADTLIAEVVALQDHLGLLNDADVAASRSRAWLTANASRVAPEALAAVRLYLDTQEAEVARLRKRFPPLWRRIEGPGYRRTLALTLAQL